MLVNLKFPSRSEQANNGLTASASCKAGSNHRVPTSVFNLLIPQRLRWFTLQKKDEPRDRHKQHVPGNQRPQDPYMPQVRMEEVSQENDNSELSQGERQGAH